MAVTFADIDLQELAALEAPERAFLTLYLSGPDSVGRLASTFQSIRALVAGHEAEREHFEQNLKLLDPLLADLSLEAPSTVVFVCWALDVAKAFPLTVEVPDKVWVGDAPYIRPLAELQDEYEDFAVIVADNNAARVFLVHAAVADGENRVRGDVKNAVKKGGWSQKRYARRREKELGQYAADVADAAKSLHDEDGFARLVLLGSQEARHAVEAALPTAVRDKLVGEGGVDVQDGAAVFRQAFALYFEGERAEEQALWEQIRGGYLTGGLAVVGAQRTLEAAQAARVEVALVERDLDVEGTKCRACEHTVFGTPDTCQRCGSTDLFTVDYVNTLTETLAQTGGEVDFVDAFEALTEVGGVGALLRY